MTHLVAGTIMLNNSSGEKQFLVKKEAETYSFVTANNSEQFTSLACILNKLKVDVYADINSLELIELTYLRDDALKMPLYVFGLESLKQKQLANKDYVWETPTTLRALLKKFQVSDIAVFDE